MDYEKARKEKDDMENGKELKEQAEFICKTYMRREKTWHMLSDHYGGIVKRMREDKCLKVSASIEMTLSSVTAYCGMSYEEAKKEEEEKQRPRSEKDRALHATRKVCLSL